MIPNLITTTLQSIDGEFANANGPFIIDSSKFDLSIFPNTVLQLPSDYVTPEFNANQNKLLQTILTANGRVDLFQNPFESDLAAVREKLNGIIQEPGLNAPVNDMLESLNHFEDHIDRLAGVTEPDANTASLPSLEKVISVGSSMNFLHQVMDSNPTNLPQLALFGSFFSGQKQLTALKSLLAQPASAITPSALQTISNTVVGGIESDVNNYFIAMKKMKRTGIGNIVFGSQEKQVESYMANTYFATPFLKGIFANTAVQKDAAAEAATLKRLADKATTRKKTQAYSQDFNSVAELISANGLWVGIEFSEGVYNKLKSMYPANQPGILNSWLSTVGDYTAAQSWIDNNQSGGGAAWGKKAFLTAMIQDFVSRTVSHINRNSYDEWLDVSEVVGGVNPNWGPTYVPKMIVKVVGGPNGLLEVRDLTFEELNILKQVIRTGLPVSGSNLHKEVRFTPTEFKSQTLLGELRQLIPYSRWYGEHQHGLPESPSSGPPGWEYENGGWRPPKPAQPWPPGVIEWVFFWLGPKGARWEPQYSASYTGERLPSDAIQPT